MANTASPQPEVSACVLANRKEEALKNMPACVRELVETHKLLPGDKSACGRTFEVLDVLDDGGFASLLKGNLYSSPGSKPKVAAAKVAIDMVTDNDGKLTEHQTKTYQSSMRREYSIYKTLLTAGGDSKGIPMVHFTGGLTQLSDKEAHPKKMHYLSFMVMDLLGPSIGCLSLELRAYQHDTHLLINHSIGMLKVLQCMHEHNMVHCDVKPDNFCLPFGYDTHNPGPVDTIFIVDMGMACSFSPSETEWEQQTALYQGTVDYSSVRALQGHHPTPKDDLESLAIAMLEMFMGVVPFDLVVEGDAPLESQRLRQMAAQKEKRWHWLLSQPQTPPFIKQWMRHLRSMPPKQHPTPRDYATLQSILVSALSPSCEAAVSAWSCDASVLQLPADPTPATAISRKRRAAPAMSAASNVMSCMSDADTVLHAKRLRLLLQDEEEVQGVSITNGLLAASQTQEE